VYGYHSRADAQTSVLTRHSVRADQSNCVYSLSSQVLSLDLSKYADPPDGPQDLASPSPVPGARLSGSGGVVAGSAGGSGRPSGSHSGERGSSGARGAGAAVTAGGSAENLLGKRKSPQGRAELAGQQASLTSALMGPPTGTLGAGAGAGRRPVRGSRAVAREAIPEETEADVEESTAS
jgi:hypothetical protein